jgi:GNAT superfamily N-acetyltransferase
MFKFERARASDWDALKTLRMVTEETMRKTGLYTPEQLNSGKQELHARFERRTMWVIKQDGALIGAIGLDGPDPRLWDDPTQEALYLYKVMAVPGMRIGGRLVEFAEFQARMQGLKFLRLNCMRDNPGLYAYWKSQGFEHLRTASGYDAGALFEKKL